MRRLPGDLLMVECAFDNLSTKDATLAINIRLIKKRDRSDESATEEMQFDPYNISENAVLTEASTAIEYKAIPAAPAGAGFLLRPGDGTVFRVTFPCPPSPSVNPGDPPPRQKVSIKLPMVKKPFVNLPLPPVSTDS